MLLCRECFLGISVSHAWNHRSLSLLTAVILREGEYHKWDNCNYLERFLTLSAALVSFQKYLCLPDKMTVILCSKHKNNLVSFFSTHVHRTPMSTQVHFSEGVCCLSPSFLLSLLWTRSWDWFYSMLPRY